MDPIMDYTNPCHLIAVNLMVANQAVGIGIDDLHQM